MVDAEPQAKFITQSVQTAQEAPLPFAFGELVLYPIAFGREKFVVPTLLGREVIIFGHPLRLDPQHLARYILAAETEGIIHEFELILLHVATE